MVFPVVGGDGKPTGYEISNSIRFDSASSSYLSFTTSTPTSQKIATWSFWMKKADDATQVIFGSSGDYMEIYNEADGELWFYLSDSNSDFLKSTALHRDQSAWYHIVMVLDTTQGTEANRAKMFVNGTQLTSFISANYPSQNDDLTGLAASKNFHIGARAYGGAATYLDAYIADFNFIDGTAYDPTYFGETNDNGVWIPKKPTGLSYGNNGFLLEFKQTGTSANASGMGADTSGNGNHFASNNLASDHITVDTPTNNFATVNPLTETQGVIDFSEGNTEIAGNTTTQGSARSSIQIPPSGKWYIESEFDAIGGSGSSAFAFVPEDYTSHALNASGARGVAGSYSNAASSRVLQLINATSQIGSNINVSAGVIVQLAIDQDNGKAWVGKEDTYYNSSGGTDGNPSTGSNPTFTFTAENFDVFFGVYKGGGGDGIQRQKVNFGNPAFSISSGNADANGYGNFEYAPPSGYYALCTKNLAEYG